MKFEELNLDAQRKHNLIREELNQLATKHDPASLARKQELMQQYKDLMGITFGPMPPAIKQIREEKKTEREKWREQRWSRREATHPK